MCFKSFYKSLDIYDKTGDVIAHISSGRGKITSMKENANVVELSLSVCSIQELLLLV